MSFARREANDIPRPDFLHALALALHPATSGHDNEGLAERMGVPVRTRARLEGDEIAGGSRRRRDGKQRIYADSASEPVDRAFARGALTGSENLHIHLPEWFDVRTNPRSDKRVASADDGGAQARWRQPMALGVGDPFRSVARQFRREPHAFDQALRK